MARRWFALTANGVITHVSDDDTSMVPRNHTAFTDAAIRAFDPPGATGRIQRGGVFSATTGYTPPRARTAGQALLSRRLKIARNLHAQASIPLGLWKDAAQEMRVAGYAEWIHANVRALLVDANLTDDTKYAKLLAESEFDGAFWFFAFVLEDWYTNNGYYRTDNTLGPATWAHYVTAPGGTGADTRSGVVSGLAMVTTVTGFSWPTELAKLVSAIT